MSAYDAAGARCVGPLCSSKVALLLRDSGALDTGAAATLEQELARRCRETAAPQETQVPGDLTVLALPILFGQAVVCTVVFGWTFRRFATSMGCQAIGKQLGIDGVALWAQARLESPVSAQRMVVYADLLRMMVGSFERQALAIARLVDLSRMREVFLASVSHELRTPLQVLNTRLEVLLRVPPVDPQGWRDALLKMKGHVAMESRLVEDLIESSRTRTGQLHIALRPSSLVDVLEASMLSVGPNAEAKGVGLHLDVSGLGAHADLSADPTRLQQVFWNLMSNAVKFTPHGGRIDVVARAIAPGYVVTVSDTGRGIAPDMLPHVFEPFTKATIGSEQGLGLGLSIAKHIVEAHGGTISVESRLEAGTSFTITLPHGTAPPAHA